jgi:hypothetical protein
LDDCDLWCIVSLPGGVFTAAGAGVKTNLLFITKRQPTEKVWYFDLHEFRFEIRNTARVAKPVGLSSSGSGGAVFSVEISPASTNR